MAEEQTTEFTKPKRSLIKLLVIGVAALAVLGGGGAAAMMLMGGDSEAMEETPPTVLADPIPSVGPIIDLGEYTVNLNETSGSRYLRVSISLEVDQSGLEDAVDERRPLINDTVLLLLSGLTFEEINTIEGKEALKAALQRHIEPFIGERTIRRILFTEFLVQ